MDTILAWSQPSAVRRLEFVTGRPFCFRWRGTAACLQTSSDTTGLDVAVFPSLGSIGSESNIATCSAEWPGKQSRQHLARQHSRGCPSAQQQYAGPSRPQPTRRGSAALSLRTTATQRPSREQLDSTSSGRTRKRTHVRYEKPPPKASHRLSPKHGGIWTTGGESW